MRLLPAAAIASLALAGCGARATVHIADHKLEVTLTEYRITPQRVSVPAGRLRLVAHNRGIVTHNVELERGSLDSGERRTVLAVIHTLLPGASEALETGPLRPGNYLLVSAVGDQTTLGMAATLIVR